MPPGQQIDAISVGIGLDLRRVKGDLSSIQAEVNRTARTGQAVNVPIHLKFANESAIRGDLKRLSTQITAATRKAGQQIDVPVRLQIRPDDFRNFRRDIERRLKSNTGAESIGIHVPIQVANIDQFRTQIQHGVGTILVKTKWGGWEGGGPPATGGRGGPGGGPRGGGPGPAPGPTPVTPRPVRAQARQTAAPVYSPPPTRPAPPPTAPPATGARQRQPAQQPAQATSNPSGRQTGTPTARTQEQAQAGFAQYEQEQRQQAINAYQGRQAQRPTPARVTQTYNRSARNWTTSTVDAQGNVLSSEVDLTRDAAVARQASMQSQIPQAPRTPRGQTRLTPEQRAERDAQRRAQRRANARRGQVAPERPVERKVTVLPDAFGDTVSVDTLRARRAQEVLEGKERAEFIAQQRATGRNVGEDPGDTAPGWQPQSGFRIRPSRAATSTLSAQGMEAIEQHRRGQERARLMADPLTREAMSHFQSGLHTMHPALGSLMDMLNERQGPDFSYEGLTKAIEQAQSAREAMQGAVPKTFRKQLQRARGNKNYSDERVDPNLLAFDSALSAAYRFRDTLVNPLAAVQKSDNANRGRGGKVGRRGGINAGRLASESIEPSAVDEIVRRRQEGGKGNGWKSLGDEFSRAEISAARARINDRKDRPEAAPIVEGQAYGGFLDTSENVLANEEPLPGGGTRRTYQQVPRPGQVPTVEGGQGMSRGNPDIGAETRSRQANRRAQQAQDALGSAPRQGPVSPGTPLGRAAAGGFGRVDDSDPGRAGRPRTVRPPQNMGGGPTPRAEEAYAEFQRGQAGNADAFGGMFKGAFRGAYRQHYQRTGPDEGEEPIIQGQSNRRVRALLAMAKAEESPNEMAAAQQILRRMGITRFAEGGVPGLPWAAVKAWTRFEGAAPRPGSRVRRELEQRYLRGQKNQAKRQRKPKYQQGGSSDPTWAKNRALQLQRQPWCASCGKKTDLTVDHILDTASGGTHDLENLQTLCRSCNGRKSGGKSARSVETPYSRYEPGGDPWGPDRTNFEDEIGMFRRAEGGSLYERVMQGKAMAQQQAQQGRLMSTGLLNRNADTDVTIVGERGPEGIVTDRGTGESHVVPAHKLPMWLARAQEGKGFAKDLTGRAEGGPLTIRNMGRAGQRYAAGGTLVGEAAARTGDVTRVFVVNWPPAFAAGGPGFGNIHGNPAQGQANAPGNAPPGAPPGTPPGTPPFTTPNAPGPGGSRSRPKLNPLTRVESRRLGYAATEDIEERLQRVSAGIAESLQEAPVRALSVAFGQIAQTAIGGRGDILARAGVARRLAGGARREQGELTSLEVKRRELALQTRDLRAGPQTPETAGQIQGNLEQLRELGPAIIRQRQITEARTARAEQAQGQILSRGQQFRAQAVGLGGIIAGTQLFTTTVAALGVAEQAASAALGPLVDQMLGWPAAIDKSTAAIRDNIAAANGNVRQGQATALAGSGVSARFLDQQGGNVTAIATARAAQQAAQQALDVTRASAGARGTGQRGLYEGTGGLAGSNFATDVFGGQEGFLQTIEKRLRVNASGINTGPADSGFLGLFPNDRAMYQSDKQWLAQNTDASGRPNFLVSPGDVTQTRNRVGAFEAAEGGPQRQVEVLADLNKNLQSAADYAGESAEAFKLVTNATKDQTDAMIKSAEATGDAGAVARARGFAEAGVTVLGPGGRSLQGTQFQTYAEQQARGQLIQDPTLLLRQTENERRARTAALMQTGTNTRTQDIPAQFALESITSPAPRFGTTFTAGGQGLASTPYGQETLDNVEKYRQLADRANTEINAGIDEGRKAMTDMVGKLGPEALTQFTGLIGKIGAYGEQIRGITEGIQMRQVNLDVQQYNEQIRVTSRSLGDARDLWSAIQGDVHQTVGGLQGQNLMLERQNQLLGRRSQRLSFKSQDIGFKQNDLQVQLQQIQFAQAQRQINFSTAVAGFAAPGTTPAERAARIEEAKLEAAEAQKQLDLQISIAEMAKQQLQIAKQQLAINKEQVANQNKQQDNQFQITVEEAKRSVTDLTKQLDLLKQARSVTIDTAAAEAAIARVQKAQGKLAAQAQSYVQEAQELRNNVIEDTARLVAATGKDWNQLQRLAQNAWDTFFDRYTQQRDEWMNGSSTNKNAANDSRHASGTIQTTSGPTRFIAGEAGTESVIVIRNPQQGMMSLAQAFGGGGGGGGGGGTYNFYITASAGMDEEQLAQSVARRVQVINDRKFSLIAGGMP